MSVSSRCVRECEPFTVTGGSATARTLESFPDDGQIGERGRGEGAQTAPLGTRSTPHTGIGVWAAAAFGLFRLCNKHAPREHHSTRLHQRKYGTMAFFASAPKSASLTHSNILCSRPAGQMKEGGGGGGGGGGGQGKAREKEPKGYCCASWESPPPCLCFSTSIFLAFFSDLP